MKAWLMDDYNGIEKLRLGELPDPAPQPGEIILEVKFAALNPADRYLAERQYPAKPALPHILGRDGMGTISQVGLGVSNPRGGEKRALLRGEVGINRPGTFAERAAIPADNLVEIPNGWSDEEAAGATLVYLTAYQALTMWGDLDSGAVVLVTGASGGVGVASVQLAKAMGCTVVGLSRSSEKSKKIQQLGASITLDPANPDWRQILKKQLAPKRVDLAIDNIGGRLLPEVIDTLGDCGRVSLVGRLAGAVPEFNTAALFFRRLRLGGVTAGAYTASEAQATWKKIVELLARINARPLVDSVFPFVQLPKAFERLAAGPMGKVLLEHPAN
jgi:NADPH2:quinone reductase